MTPTSAVIQIAIHTALNCYSFLERTSVLPSSSKSLGVYATDVLSVPEHDIDIEVSVHGPGSLIGRNHVYPMVIMKAFKDGLPSKRLDGFTILAKSKALGGFENGLCKIEAADFYNGFELRDPDDLTVETDWAPGQLQALRQA